MTKSPILERGRLWLGLLGCSATLLTAEPTIIAVHPTETGQEFQGMGCGAIFYEAHVTSLGANGHPAEQEQLYDAMFKDVRADILQLQIRPNHEPANDNDDPYALAFNEKDLAYCQHPLKIAAAAKARNPRTKLYAVLYTPPPWMKTNATESGGGKARGTLKPGLELEFGEYIWAFLTHMQQHGQTIDYLSICNEPDWEHDQPSYFLTTEQHTNLFVKIAAYLKEMAIRNPAVPRPKLVAPNMLSAVDAAQRQLPPLLAAAGNEIDVVGNHDYDRRGHRWAKLRELAGTKPLWETECCFNGEDKSPGLMRSASEYWLYMTEAFNEGVNVWQAYDYVYPPHPGGEALIHVQWGKSFQLTKIYHGFRQWCAPLEPGMKVVTSTLTGPGATGISQAGVKSTSFVSKDGRTLVVHVASVQEKDAEVIVQLDPPFATAAYRQWRTSPTEDYKEQETGNVQQGKIPLHLIGRALVTMVCRRSD